MGASTFITSGQGRDAQQAFSRAVDDALYAYGHDGYTGSIAEKTDFVMVTTTGSELKELVTKKVAELRSQIKAKAVRETAWGPGHYRPYTTERKLEKWEIEELRHEVSRLRALKKTLRARMDPSAIARALIVLDDQRYLDKYGSCGCIDCDPRLSGKRKDKRFLFFGMAAE